MPDRDPVTPDNATSSGFLAEKVEDQRRHLNKLLGKYNTVKGQLRLERSRAEAAEARAEKFEASLARLASTQAFIVAFDMKASSAETLWAELRARGQYAEEALAESVVGEGHVGDEFKGTTADRKDHKDFYCPNGHGQPYAGLTDAESEEER